MTEKRDDALALLREILDTENISPAGRERLTRWEEQCFQGVEAVTTSPAANDVTPLDEQRVSITPKGRAYLDGITPGRLVDVDFPHVRRGALLVIAETTGHHIVLRPDGLRVQTYRATMRLSVPRAGDVVTAWKGEHKGLRGEVIDVTRAGVAVVLVQRDGHDVHRFVELGALAVDADPLCAGGDADSPAGARNAPGGEG